MLEENCNQKVEIAKLKGMILSKNADIAELKFEINYLKSVIRSLLENSDEYAIQRGWEAIKE